MRYWLAAILFILPLGAQAYVSPGSPDGFVNDFAGVISQSQEQQLEALLSEYEQKTGNEIAVAIINSLGDETVETYAVRLFEEWGIGKQGQDNGALFVVAVDDREMRIETGYGLEGDLTDIESKRIISDAVSPHFSAGDFDEGVHAAVADMLRAVGAEIETGAVVAPRANGGGSFFGQFFWLFIFIFIWMASVFARSRSWWAGGVVGGAAGVITGLASGAWLWLPILAAAGFLLDYLVSTKFRSMFIHKDGSTKHHSIFPWIFLIGGGRHPWDKGGGGFGGFGGGMSGGGGASGRW